MMTFLGYAFLVVLAVAVVVLLARRVFPTWFHLGRTKAQQADDYAATIDPAGQMRQSALDAAEELKQADNALEASDTLQRSLQRQIDEDTKTVSKVRGQIANLIRPKSEGGKGLSQNDPVVVEKLKRVRDTDNAIQTNQNQLNDQIKVYEATLKNANKAGAKIAATVAEADRLKVQLNLGEQTVKINAMLAKYNPTAVNSKLAAVDRYRQAAQTKLDGYAAKGRVAADRGVVNDDDDDDVTPDTDPELASILDGIKNPPPKTTAAAK